MTDREALATLIEAAFISETDKARLLALVPTLSDEDVQEMGALFANEERALDERLREALTRIDAFLGEQDLK